MLIKIFPIAPKAHSNFSKKFQLRFNLIFSKEIIQKLLHHKSKHHETKPMHPSLSRAFQRHQEHKPEASQFSRSHDYNTKQNKTTYLPSIYAPVLVESFPKTPRTWSEASQFSRSHDYNTKQNKTTYLPSIYAPILVEIFPKTSRTWSQASWFGGFHIYKTKQTTFLLSMHQPSSRVFQKHQEHDLKHPGSVDLISTKQNKLLSFIDRWYT